MLKRWLILAAMFFVLSLWGLQITQALQPRADSAGWIGAVHDAARIVGLVWFASDDGVRLFAFTPSQGVGWFASESFAPWLPLIRVQFPSDLVRSVGDLFARNGDGTLVWTEQTAAWWACVWLVGLGFGALIAADPVARGRVASEASPRWSSVALLAGAGAVLWLGVMPALFVVRKFAHEVMASGLDLQVPIKSVAWIDPRLANGAATVACLSLVAVAMVVLARGVLWLRQPRPEDGAAARAGVCRRCEYAVGELPRCPECGDTDPRGPRAYYLTRVGAWLDARAWRRWWLRVGVAAWVVLAMTSPALVGTVNMVGYRAGWW